MTPDPTTHDVIDRHDAAQPITQAVRRAAARATLAPSIHNTQPWRIALFENAIEIHADESRRLSVLDPRGRQLTISCGCALFNARVALAGWGFEPVITRLPDRERPHVLARISVGERHSWSAIAGLDDSIEQRRTNRRAFLNESLPAHVIDRLVAVAEEEGTTLVAIDSPEQRAMTAQLSRLADRIEESDSDYHAEVRRWTTDDPRRLDGVQASAIPYVDQDHRTNKDAVPIRMFDSTGMGWLPHSSRSDENQCLLLFTAPEDDRLAWLRAGEAVERVWLELTRRGYWASPLSQVIEVTQTHGQLRSALGLTAHPQLLLRVGRAPHIGPSRRRALDDVLIEP
jgi:hypothetical protein